jgi:hypothetical protein
MGKPKVEAGNTSISPREILADLYAMRSIAHPGTLEDLAMLFKDYAEILYDIAGELRKIAGVGDREYVHDTTSSSKVIKRIQKILGVMDSILREIRGDIDKLVSKYDPSDISESLIALRTYIDRMIDNVECVDVTLRFDGILLPISICGDDDYEEYFDDVEEEDSWDTWEEGEEEEEEDP